MCLIMSLFIVEIALLALNIDLMILKVLVLSLRVALVKSVVVYVHMFISIYAMGCTHACMRIHK